MEPLKRVQLLLIIELLIVPFGPNILVRTLVVYTCMQLPLIVTMRPSCQSLNFRFIIIPDYSRHGKFLYYKIMRAYYRLDLFTFINPVMLYDSPYLMKTQFRLQMFVQEKLRLP